VAVSFRGPAAPFEGKRRGGNLFFYFTAAFRAFPCGRIGEFLTEFKNVAAGVALIFIERHLLTNLLKSGYVYTIMIYPPVCQWLRA
jgi:hypothetical protein